MHLLHVSHIEPGLSNRLALTTTTTLGVRGSGITMTSRALRDAKGLIRYACDSNLTGKPSSCTEKRQRGPTSGIRIVSRKTNEGRNFVRGCDVAFSRGGERLPGMVEELSSGISRRFMHQSAEVRLLRSSYRDDIGRCFAPGAWPRRVQGPCVSATRRAPRWPSLRPLQATS